jgi:uncharacterized repeat protein (TIGR02543 family)
VQVHNYLVTFAPSVPGGSDGSSVRVYATTFTAGVRTLAPDPTRAGFAFAGWSTQADGSGAPFTASSTITADLTVYPTWTAVPVTPGSGSTPSDTGIGATTATGATLASTGLDATPALIVGSILSVLGLAGIYLRRRLAVTGR